MQQLFNTFILNQLTRIFVLGIINFMTSALFCITEFATKLVAGLSGLIVAIAIIVIVWLVMRKKG